MEYSSHAAGHADRRLIAIGVAISALAFLAGRWSVAIPVKTLMSAQTDSTAAARGSTNPRSAQPAATRAAAVQPHDPDPITNASAERAAEVEIEALARIDPPAALRRAASERNQVIRHGQRNAALRGWAAVAPDDAARWAITLPRADRANALDAVLAVAAADPAVALRLGAKACQDDPENRSAYGQLVIQALADRGAFEPAVSFALEAADADRPAWLNTVFTEWATYSPERALAEVQAITDAGARDSARAGVMTGWATADPEGLAEYAAGLSPGPTRVNALRQALACWVQENPAAALHWIGGRDPAEEYDAAFAGIATLSSLVSTRPDLAMDCANSIADPGLRRDVARFVMQAQPAR